MAMVVLVPGALPPPRGPAASPGVLAVCLGASPRPRSASLPSRLRARQRPRGEAARWARHPRIGLCGRGADRVGGAPPMGRVRLSRCELSRVYIECVPRFLLACVSYDEGVALVLPARGHRAVALARWDALFAMARHPSYTPRCVCEGEALAGLGAHARSGLGHTHACRVPVSCTRSRARVSSLAVLADGVRAAG